MKPRLKPPSSCSYSYSYSYSVLKRNQSAQKRSALMPEHASSPSFLDLLLREAGGEYSESKSKSKSKSKSSRDRCAAREVKSLRAIAQSRWAARSDRSATA